VTNFGPFRSYDRTEIVSIECTHGARVNKGSAPSERLQCVRQGPWACLHPNTTPSVISQRAIFAYVWNSGTRSSAPRAPASASSLPPGPGPGPPNSSSATPFSSSASSNLTYKPSAQRMAVGITHDVVLRPILKKVAENEAPGPDHSDMVPSHYYPFPLPHDTCLHTCHFWSLTYFFFPPVVQILQVIRVAYQLTSLSSPLSAASPFNVPASTATIFAKRCPALLLYVHSMFNHRFMDSF
jgi:hypothetical protein